MTHYILSWPYALALMAAFEQMIVFVKELPSVTYI